MYCLTASCTAILVAAGWFEDLMEEFSSWILEFFVMLMQSAFTSLDERVTDSIEILTNLGTSGDMSQWEAIQALSSTLIPFCNTIICICFLIELCQVAQKVDMLKWEMALKMGVKYALSVEFINIAPTFLRACYLQANSWLSGMGAASTSYEVGVTAYNKIGSLATQISGLGNAFGLMGTAAIVLLAIQICGIMVQVIAYGRMFEICVYLVVSPLPCAFFPLGNGNGEGFSRITMRFLRSFAAVCLQGVMMLIVIQVFDTLLTGTMNEIMTAAEEAYIATSTPEVALEQCTNAIFMMLMGAVAMVMSITKCGSWAKSILDAA